MILAAGRGERMRPLTDSIPKPLLEVGGKPLIVWHIERLVKAGLTELVVNHAHLGGQIEQTLGDGHQFGVSIHYSPEGTALETAGGIAHALPILSDGGRMNEPFAVINSDIFCDYDFALMHEHATRLKSGGDTMHLVLVNNPLQHPDGDFCLQGQRITSNSPKLTFSGIGIYHTSVFEDIPNGGIAPLAPLLRAQIALGKVSGEQHLGVWVDVGTPQRLIELDRQLRK